MLENRPSAAHNHSHKFLKTLKVNILKAILIQKFGGSDQLVIDTIPTPKAEMGRVLIKVKAFGVNRAETYMRRGLFGEVVKVSGIECVGLVEQDPSGKFAAGQKVVAIMGGMGRVINGSYAEYTSVPVENVFAIDTTLSWEELASVPESYATAWTALHENMALKPGQTVLIRGATSALGQAAINIAANTPGVTVLAATRNEANTRLLTDLGARRVLIEDGYVGQQVRKLYPDGIDSVMDIVGNSTLLDSLKAVKKGGTVCNTGFLGGGDPIQFNPLADMPSLVNLNFFASFNFGKKDFPISNIPMQEIVDRAAQGVYKASPKKVFKFDEIAEAHDLMESNTVCGKIVVVV